MAADDGIEDDVFEDDPHDHNSLNVLSKSKENTTTPSPTGYRGYKPPQEILQLAEGTLPQIEPKIHKTILLGDSGVGKTSLLVKFDTGKFQQGNFAATVGIGFTVLVVGDSCVGKTCLLVRFNDDVYLSGNFISTVGLDFRNKVVTVDDTKVKLQIWDTAGQERFRSITHAYYRDAHALLLLYDVTNKTSFDNIRAWLTEIREYAKDDVVIMLIGNKCDCNSERLVRREDGDRLAREYNVAFMETSAKMGLNVDLAFMAIARELKYRQSGNHDKNSFRVQDYVREQTYKTNCTNCNG